MKLSEALGVPSKKLWRQGVFDSYIGIDSRLHVDPALLRVTTVPEIKPSAERLFAYFRKALKLLVASLDGTGSVLDKQARKWICFPEITEAALGYAQGSNRGRGLTGKRASDLFETARAIVRAGVDDPEIFEIAVIFQENFGADLISDMTVSIIAEDLGSFNARVCHNLGIPTDAIRVRGADIPVAYSEQFDRKVLLVPYSLLSDLPEASSFEDIGTVVSYNSKLRETLNKVLGDRWASEFKRLTKAKRKDMFLRHPELLRDIVKLYRKSSPKPYDFEADPLGEILWEEAGQEAADAHQLQLSMPRSPSKLRETVLLISKQFKRLIEENAVCDLLYFEGRRRSEKFAQLLFYSIADSYCRANNLDLSAEPNAGQGPVDFKVSSGYTARAAVELKLSDNSKALAGLLSQLPRYAIAEQATVSCFVLIVVGKSRAAVDAIVQERNKLLKKGKKMPDLVVIDAWSAYNEPSASKLI